MHKIMHLLSVVYPYKSSGPIENIHNHPLVPPSIPVYGYIYDVKIGRLIEAPDATAVGKIN